MLASETALKVTQDALQIHGSMGYSRDLPMERLTRDARMFTIAGGTAQILRTQVAGAILASKRRKHGMAMQICATRWQSSLLPFQNE